jgi:hypothetical protein
LSEFGGVAPSLTRKNLAARKLVEKRRDSIKHYICEDLPKEREGERRREKEREGERRREKELLISGVFLLDNV